MSTPRKARHGRSKSEYLETAKLEVLVPHQEGLDIIAAMKAAHQGGDNLGLGKGAAEMFGIRQRKFLFYDETLTTYVVLEQPASIEDSRYNAYLARLAISLEVTAVDGSPHRQSSHPSRPSTDGIHLLFQTTIDEAVTPRIEVRTPTKRFSLWKVQVPLGHPKAKLTLPQIVLAASAVLRQVDQSASAPAHNSEYIDTWAPFGANLLEPYGADPALAETVPKLSALRVSRHVPHSRVDRNPITQLGFSPRRTFPVYPAIIIRLRYSRLISGNRQDVIASLDIEVTSYGECNVRVENVEIKVSDGHAELLGPSPYSSFPIECQPRDDITLLYSLEQSDLMRQASATDANALRRPVSVSLRATALIDDKCAPVITTNWDTNIDFSTPTSTPSSSRRASSASGSGAIAASTVSSAPGIQPRRQKSHRHNPSIQFTLPPGGDLSSLLNARPSSSTATSSTTAAHPAAGLTITFSGPTRVHVGRPFSWQVFVFNAGRTPRKFILIVAPRRRRGAGADGKPLPPHPSTGMPVPALDATNLHAVARAALPEPVDLIPLDNDVRVGPLAPGSCHMMSLRFLPLREGVLGVEGVRVVDLGVGVGGGGGETTEVRELPSIVCVEGEGDEDEEEEEEDGDGKDGEGKG